jgi:hypothetical protein
MMSVIYDGYDVEDQKHYVFDGTWWFDVQLLHIS